MRTMFLGGRVGRGKVFVSCPHPEFDESSWDMVRSGLKYLTGVSPSAVDLGRVRGAPAVCYSSSDKASAEYLFGTLNRDARIHVWPGKALGNLFHMDAVIFTDEVTDDDARKVKGFMARGGRVVVVADNGKELEAAKKIKGAVVLESYDGVVDAVLR